LSPHDLSRAQFPSGTEGAWARNTDPAMGLVVKVEKKGTHLKRNTSNVTVRYFDARSARIERGCRTCIGLYCLSGPLIATLIPIADAMIVLRQGGSRTIAFGVHGGTAVAMLIISGLLLID
jgi:hypothetical protein